MFQTIRHLLIVGVCVGAAENALRADVLVEVSAGKYDRRDTPVSVVLPRNIEREFPDVLDGQRWSLVRLDNGKHIPAQFTTATTESSLKGHRLAWLLSAPLAAGTSRRYRLENAAPVDDRSDEKRNSEQEEGVTTNKENGRLQVNVAGKPVLVYNAATVKAADRNEAYYDRSGHLHPIYNPRGQAVTDDFPPDHPHQHGLMFPWTNTRFEGRAVNFWDQKNQTGTVEHAAIESLHGGQVSGGFRVRLKHLDLTTPKKPKTVLEETWSVRVYNLADAFLFDLESIQRCVGSPLHIQKYHYGALAIRGHRNWLTSGQGDFLTSEGMTRKDGNHSRPRWCDMHGLIDGQTTGVTIFCHPENFRAPQPVRLHPQKPYFCFAPMVLGEFAIEAGSPYVSRYRFLVHNGELDVGAAERCWRDLEKPPEVKVEIRNSKSETNSNDRNQNKKTK